MSEIPEKAWIDLKTLRESRGWLQSDVAEQMGVSREYISYLENGQRGISKKVMPKIIEAYGVKYEDFHTHARLLPFDGVRMKTVPLAITVWDKDFNLIDCAQYMVDYMGFSGKQDLLDRLVSLAPEYQPDGRQSRKVLSESLQAALDTGYHYCNWTHQTATGKPINIDVLMVRMNRDDKPVIVAYGRDINNKMKLRAGNLTRSDSLMQSHNTPQSQNLEMIDETELEPANQRQYKSVLRAQMQAQSQADWYKYILDALPFPVRVADADKKWIYINSPAASLFEVRREDMLGKPCFHKKFSICGTKNCSLARAKQGLYQTDFEHDGSPYHMEVKILMNAQGAISGYVELIYDVTKAVGTAPRNTGAADGSIFEESTENEPDTRLEQIHSSGRLLLDLINNILEISHPRGVYVQNGMNGDAG